MIYFDNAATSFHKPPSVAQAVLDSFGQVGNAARGINQMSLAAERIVYGTRQLLAELFQTGPKQIAFSSGSTESLNTLIQGFVQPGDHVITTVMEHNSVLRPLYRIGCQVDFLGITDDGRLDTTKRDDLIRPNTTCLIITQAANLTGVINDLSDWGEWCQKHNIELFVDASQTAGVLPIRMKDMQLSAVAFTGHKGLFGPQGTGGLAVREGLDIRPLKVGGSGIATFAKEHPPQMPTRLESGTLNIHGLAGLKAGLEFIQTTGLTAIHKRETALRQHFLDGLNQLPVQLYGHLPPAVGIVALNAVGMDSALLGGYLSDEGILIRSGGHCAPLHHEAFGTVEQGMVRFSFSYFNTFDEVDKALDALTNILL